MSQSDNSKSHAGEYCSQMQSFEVSMYAKDNDKASGTFNNQIQFLLSTLGYAVSYGNIWRFPYMLYQHGGGAFFVPYLICLAILVFPLFYLEIAFGQMYRKALHRYYDTIHPKLLGLSFTVAAICFFIATYMLLSSLNLMFENS